MLKMILAASPLVLAVTLAAPALADGLDGRGNQSIEGFSGSASLQQMPQATHFRTAPATPWVAGTLSGSNNASQESYSPGSAAAASRSRFSPQTADRPDGYSWIGEVRGGA